MFEEFTKYIDNDGSLSLFTVFNVENFPDDISSLATYGNQQIEQLSERCVRYGYISAEEGTNAKDEWPQLKASFHNLKKSLLKSSKKINPSLSILSQILVSNPPNVRNILILVEYMSNFSCSQAATERGHASVDLVVTKQRPLLSEENIQHLLRVKHNTKDICQYDPVPAIKFWFTACMLKNQLVKL